MVKLKGCPRCHGDVTTEEIFGEIEVVCLQCGYRGYPAYRLDRPRRSQRGRRGVHFARSL